MHSTRYSVRSTQLIFAHRRGYPTMSADVTYRKIAAPLPRDLEYPSPLGDALPSIVRPARAHHVVWLAVLSGLLSTFALCTGNNFAFWVGPGVLFGVFVL